MWSRTLSVAVTLFALAGCPGGSGGIGDSCGDSSDCAGNLQCLAGSCEAKCQRAPECGDGYACDSDGNCKLATGESGDKCKSEVDCAPGLSCQIDGTATDPSGHLLAACTAQNPARPAGSSCAADSECRNGTCALGRCVDLCEDTRDCGSGLGCMNIPRVESDGAPFLGCLPPRGTVAWEIPVSSPTQDTILVPIPDAARAVTIVFSVDDQAQRVGAKSVTSPSGAQLYTKPCDAGTAGCTAEMASDQYFAQPLRHLPDFGQSVMQLPSIPTATFETGAYRIAVSSFRANGGSGTSVPHVTAVVKMDATVFLDLHFHFLNLDEHPCSAAFGSAGALTASTAADAAFFQTDFLGELRTVFAGGGIALGTIGYEDIRTQAGLDGLAVEDAGSLLALGTHTTGIDVFFVRTLSPVGLQAFGPNPGPAGVPGTRQSGIVIGVDTLCYRSWTQLARLTAHEIARYMGLYHNVELGVGSHPSWRDPIDDSDDTSGNLMYFSELGGIDLSAGQRDILSRSAVLR